MGHFHRKIHILEALVAKFDMKFMKFFFSKKNKTNRNVQYMNWLVVDIIISMVHWVTIFDVSHALSKQHYSNWPSIVVSVGG